MQHGKSCKSRGLCAVYNSATRSRGSRPVAVHDITFNARMDKDDQFRLHASMDADTDRGQDSPVAFTRRWRPLRARLSPLIGENGFGALFGRAVSLVAPGFDCFNLDTAPKTSDQWFAALEERLSTIDTAAGVGAHAALMDAFTRQLAGMIGTALTERLLAAALDGGGRHDKHRSTSK
jgi:hypothetical protein